jgi:hypothetical protein
MDLHSYTINHNNSTLVLTSANKIIYASSWFSEFGKFGCEVFNENDEIIYKISKQFQFWKWKMVFEIKKKDTFLVEMQSQNNKKTIFSVDINEITYEIRIHYKKRISIYKNDIKISEVDESFSDEGFKKNIKLLLIDKKDLEICFLLFSCLKIGETDQNTRVLIASQKQLEVNEDPW